MNYFLNLNSKDYFYKKIFFNHLEINYFLNLIETIELIFNFKIDIKNLSLNFSFLNSFLLIEHLIGKKPVLQEVKFIVNLSSKKTNFYNFLLSSVLKEKFKINYILDFWGSLFAMRNLLINNYFLKTYFFWDIVKSKLVIALINPFFLFSFFFQEKLHNKFLSYEKKNTFFFIINFSSKLNKKKIIIIKYFLLVYLSFLID